MNILCIETSASLCSVALVKGETVFYCENTRSMAHAEVLMDLIKTCLEKAGTEIKELNAVAISGGPGSYTGLRIGCSSAKGICYALSIPLIVIDTLKIVAYQAREKNKSSVYYWAMIDARRMEVYHGVFNRDLEQMGSTKSEVITEQDFVPAIIKESHTILCGDGAKKAAPILNLENVEVIANAAGMCELVVQAWQDKDFADVAYYEPFYLKQANITVSKS